MAAARLQLVFMSIRVYLVTQIYQISRGHSQGAKRLVVMWSATAVC